MLNGLGRKPEDVVILTVAVLLGLPEDRFGLKHVFGFAVGNDPNQP